MKLAFKIKEEKAKRMKKNLKQFELIIKLIVTTNVDANL